MTTQTTELNPPPRRWLRSVVAILAGFLAVFVISLATDQLFHALEVYPAWGQPMYGTGQNLLALSYRLVYGVLGGWIAARLAPRAPMAHALILGAIGVVLSTLGTIAMWDFGPHWYPIAIVVTALPCAWLGAVLHRVTLSQHAES